MSDTEPIHDDGTGSQEPSTDPAARSPLLLIGAVVGAVVLAALVWFFLVTPLLLGDDAGTAQDDPAAPGTPADDGTTAPGGDVSSPDGSATDDPPLADEPEELPLVTFEVFLARDPFEPVVPEPVSDAPTAEDPADEGEPSDPSAPADPSDGDEDTPSPPPGDGDGAGVTPPPSAGDRGDTGRSGCRGEEEVVCDGRTVSLVEVVDGTQGRMAVVQVDSTLYEVRRGDRFAGTFLVQEVTDERITLVFGDDVFSLTVGDRVLK